MKKIIFIGGTSHSGSTILDLLLANHPKALSLGEIHALMNPYRPHHFEKRKKLAEKDERWNKIINDKPKYLYRNLIKIFDDKFFFIDSSKDPIWIAQQQKFIKRNTDAQSYNILIYKTPYEFAYSKYKRGATQSFQWYYQWQRYHRFLFSLIDSFLVVSYKDINKNTLTLDILRQYTGIAFESEKIVSQQENFFGSTNQGKLGNDNLFLNYNVKENYTLHEEVNHILQQNDVLKNIFNTLNDSRNKEINTNNSEISTLTYNSLYKFLILSKRKIERLYRQFFPDYKWNKKQHGF